MALPSYDPRQFNKSRKPIDAKPIDRFKYNELYELLKEDKRVFDRKPQPINIGRPIDDLIGGGAVRPIIVDETKKTPIEEKKEVIVEPTKKNNLPMIIGVVVIGAILYFVYKKK